MKKEYPVLYRYSKSKKSIEQWQVIAENDTFYTIHGQKDGKLTVSKPTVCYGKNIGKKNATTPDGQAISEAEAKVREKMSEGYNEVLQTERNYTEPMLAKVFADEMDAIDWEGEDVWIQPKLDGIRALNDKDQSLTSRKGKPFTSCPHVYQTSHLLDGELYSHEYKHDFNTISKMVKTHIKNLSPEQLAEIKNKMKFWAYDFPEHKGVFSERYAKLQEWYDGLSEEEAQYFMLTPTFKVSSYEEVLDYFELFRIKGYEGAIVRRDIAHYEYKRSKQLLKLKEFTDEEFTIIGYEEGKGGRAGTIGKFLMKHDKDERANFKSNVKGNHAFLREVWLNRDYYIGKSATIQFFNRTPYKADGTGDKPRHPYIIKLDRESYE